MLLFYKQNKCCPEHAENKKTLIKAAYNDFYVTLVLILYFKLVFSCHLTFCMVANCQFIARFLFSCQNVFLIHLIPWPLPPDPHPLKFFSVTQSQHITCLICNSLFSFW